MRIGQKIIPAILALGVAGTALSGSAIVVVAGQAQVAQVQASGSSSDNPSTIYQA
jgi:hypothetical protein